MKVDSSDEVKRKRVKKKSHSFKTSDNDLNVGKKQSKHNKKNKAKRNHSEASKNKTKNKRKSKEYNQEIYVTAKPVTAKSRLIGMIGNLLFYGVLLVFIIGAGLVYFGDKDANIFGYKIMTVLTESMKPNKQSEYKNGFNKGSLIFVRSQDPYQLEKGDIITFNPVRDNDKVFLTHRVIEINDEVKDQRGAFITTKGDANNGNDVPIGASQVQGKVVKSIPNAGYVLAFLKKHIIVVAILLSTMFGIVVTLKYLKAVY